MMVKNTVMLIKHLEKGQEVVESCYENEDIKLFVSCLFACALFRRTAAF